MYRKTAADDPWLYPPALQGPLYWRTAADDPWPPVAWSGPGLTGQGQPGGGTGVHHTAGQGLTQPDSAENMSQRQAAEEKWRT